MQASKQPLILRYGLVAGLIVIGVNTLSLELGFGFVWLGFLVMFLAFGLIFVAIARHRDNALGGVIGFGTAFWLGLGVTVVATLVYVALWELYLYLHDYNYIDQYLQGLVDAQKAAGASAEALQALAADNDTMRQQYANPWIRLPMTAMEIAPVGLLVSLVAAAVLRTRNR